MPIEIPSNISVEVLEPHGVFSDLPSDQLIQQALDVPVGSSFEEFLQAPGSLLVIVNDGTRPTPTRLVLSLIADLLDKANAEFIVATGVHREPNPEEYGFIFGETYDRFKNRIHVHHARTDEMEYYGNTRNGTEVYLNRIGAQADKVLVIGSVEPHYFAGYTGGRKGFLPGISGFSTIEQNHKLALEPTAVSLALEGNPVHEDMVDALSFLEKKNIFSIMTVLDKNHEIYAVTSGDLIGAFDMAVHKANEVFVVPIKEKADIVISCAKYPMDVDLYQSQKAIDNGKLGVKEDGIMILVSSCRDGVGEEAFQSLLSSSGSPEEVLEKIRMNYKLGYHKAGKMAEAFLKCKVWAYTDLKPSLVSEIFMRPVSDLQKAVDEAIQEKGGEARILILTDGCVTVPSA